MGRALGSTKVSLPDLRALALNQTKGVTMAIQALTLKQLDAFNAARPRKLLCMLKHKMYPVLKPLPIRNARGGITRHPINRCVRCGFAEITD